MPLRRRLSMLLAMMAAIAAGVGGAMPAHAAQPIRGRDLASINVPQFVVTAVKFKALDETGWDWTGADEVHAVFVDYAYADLHMTSEYGSVDADETKNFRAEDQCIAPQPKCDRGAKELHFAVALWESDWTPSAAITGCRGHLVNSHDAYDDGICQGDDLIGRAEMTFSTADLLALLPAVGTSVDRTVKPTGGAGSYQFTYRIARLPNIERTIVIHEPTTLGISLQATVDTPASAKRVILTWSGASGASVDIVRGAALVATTANDGQDVDKVPSSGTYEYRLCNAGTTVCSPTVSVTVP